MKPTRATNEARLRKLEGKHKRPGRIIVWYSDTEPEPEHDPEDIVLQVVYVSSRPATQVQP